MTAGESENDGPSPLLQAKIRTTSIEFSKTGVIPPVVEFETGGVLNEKTRLYIDSGADVCIIKEGKSKKLDDIDSSELLIINGVAKGEFKSMGVITMRINGIQ